MAGLLGIALAEPIEFSDPLIKVISDSLAAVGADSCGFHREPGILLGMRNLVGSDSGQIQAVADGEIHNHREIRDRLVREGHAFGSPNGLEVLAHLSETRTLDWELGLRGMVAFAVWDRESRNLRLARDRFGMKSLFWCGDSEGIAFASSLKDLKTLLLSLGGAMDGVLPSPSLASLATPDGWRLNKTSLRWYFDTSTIPSPETIYEGIQSLDPATRLIWQSGKPIEQTRYWTPSYRPSRKIGLNRALEEFKVAFKESVRLNLASESIVGAILSGDIDSGYLVAQTAEQSRSRLRTFTVGIQGADGTDLDIARRIASLCGTEHHEIHLGPPSIADLSAIASALSQPLGDPCLWPTWAVSKAVGAELPVVLTSEGCKELWGGYPYHRLYHLTRWLPKNGQARLDVFRTPESLYRSRRRFDLPADFWDRLLRAEFQVSSPEIPFADTCDLDAHERMSLADAEFLLPHLGLRKLDLASGFHSLVIRAPWLDPVLFETVAHFPSRLKINGGLTHWLLRKAVASGRGASLPTSILNRKSESIKVPVHDWMRSSLATLFQDTALAVGSEVSRILDQRELRKVFEAHRSRNAQWGQSLWAVLILELWLRENRPRL